ncbi:MAG: enoyl-CoA hydratase [Deltaproteobacteria bacterium]|nr:MAG: enoyl-CoA hydratase [Deltaproteobacteria bacterium]
MEKAVISEVRGGILTMTLNRPTKKNALTNEMYGLLYEGLVRAEREGEIRVVLIRGAEENFTSGNDLSDFAAVVQGELKLDDLNVVHLINTMVDFGKPIVAAVKGYAIGFGTTMLFHCDSVVAGRGACFQLPFVQLGLVPEFGSTRLFPRLAGKIRAHHYLMTGERFDAATAFEMGMISLLCEDDEVDEAARSVCRRLAAAPPATLRAIKALTRPPQEREALKSVILHELQQLQERLQSPEHWEALQAFFEKRQPDFSRFS